MNVDQLWSNHVKFKCLLSILALLLSFLWVISLDLEIILGKNSLLIQDCFGYGCIFFGRSSGIWKFQGQTMMLYPKRMNHSQHINMVKAAVEKIFINDQSIMTIFSQNLFVSLILLSKTQIWYRVLGKSFIKSLVAFPEKIDFIFKTWLKWVLKAVLIQSNLVLQTRTVDFKSIGYLKILVDFFID